MQHFRDLAVALRTVLLAELFKLRLLDSLHKDYQVVSHLADVRLAVRRIFSHGRRPQNPFALVTLVDELNGIDTACSHPRGMFSHERTVKHRRIRQVIRQQQLAVIDLG